MSKFEFSEDAEVIYQGKADVKKYGASSTSEPYIGINSLDITQFDYILTSIDNNTPVICIMGDEHKMLWHCDMQLKGTYDNTADQWIKLAFKYDQNMVDLARTLVHKTLNVTIIKGEVSEKPKKLKGEHGQYASELIQSKLMKHPSFWPIVGTEESYLHWLRRQPCLITGKGVRIDTGEDLCEAAHVREVKYGAGMATKPEYFAVPLHPKVHAQQHEKGVYDMWKKAGRPTPSSVVYPIEDNKDHVRQWLQITTLNYIKKWIQQEIKDYFNVESMSFISADKFEQYVRDKADPQVVDKVLELSRQKN